MSLCWLLSLSLGLHENTDTSMKGGGGSRKPSWLWLPSDGFEGCSVVPEGTQWDNVDSGKNVKTRLFYVDVLKTGKLRFPVNNA